MTHPTIEKLMRKAIKKTGKLPVVQEINNFIRVEE